MIGVDLSLTALVGALLTRKEGKIAIIRFCEEVIAAKEARKRSRKTMDPTRHKRRQRSASARRRARSTATPN